MSAAPSPTHPRDGGDPDGLTAAQLLDWMGQNPAMSLTYEYGEPDDDAGAWRVYREHGGVNDREWDTLGEAETPIGALRCAWDNTRGQP